MKCRECSSRYRGYWASAPEAYMCVDVEEPFEIIDDDAECVRHQYEPDGDKLPNICPKCGAIMGGDKNA